MQNILNQDELNFLLRGQKPAAEGGRSAQPGPETEAPSPAEETLRSADTPSPSGAGGRSWQEIFSEKSVILQGKNNDDHILRLPNHVSS